MADIIPLSPRGHGATRDEWVHFDLMLGLTADLLPVVSNPNAKISPHSAMQGVGKTPSMFNQSRMVAGFPQWTQYHATAQDIDKWAKEPDYGICIQTRSVRAIDVDLADDHGAALVLAQTLEKVGILPKRIRSNSPKFLLAFTLPGDFTKRKFKTAHGIVEFLATGQQFIACGTHPSGARYEWEGGLPDEFPTLTAEEFESLWADLVREFAIEDATTASSSVKAQKLADVVSSDPVAQHLLDKSLVKRMERDGRLHIACPWEDEHTTDTGDTATTYWPAHTGGYAQGHFHCLHAHCEHRSDEEFKDAIGYVDADLLTEFEAIKEAQPDIGIPTSETSQPKQRFKVESAHEFASRPPPKWIVKGVLPQAEMAVVYGDSGSGKTFFMLDLVAAIARGEEWRGRICKKGRVVYVAAEGAAGLRSRLKAYSHQHALTLADLPIGIIAAAPNMMEKADAVDVAKSIVAAGGADIVVLDTFAQVMPGANENSGEDVGRALAHCKGIHRATGALVILVHHSGKDSSRGARGWSGLRAAADAEIEVVRADDLRSATVTKLKDGEDGAEFGFRLNTVVLGLDEDGEEITSCVLEHTDEAAKVRTRRKVKGELQKLALTTLDELIASDLGGDGVTVLDLVAEVVKRLPKEEGKEDKREFRARRTIDKLVEDGVLVANGTKLSVAE